MTENEAKEILENDSCYECTYGTSFGASECKNKDCEIANATKLAIKALEEIQQYRAIGTVEEFKDLKEYKAKMEMQYLDDINNPLEPLKLSSALQSEIFKYNYRKEHKPQDISPLDYTIMYALKHCLEET